MKKFILALLFVLTSAATTFATSGPGCLVVVNVAYDDVLNVRARPSASSRIVATLEPDNHGVVQLNGKCRPLTAAWGNRWCPVKVHDGNGTTRGWVKARFVRDSDCP